MLFRSTLPMCGYVSVTIWPSYEGSVRISWYPVIDVLNTTSPTVLPSAPIARPRNSVPSASASSAGTTGGKSDERETIGGLDAEQNGGGALAGLAGDETGLDALLLEEAEDEVAYGVGSDGGEDGARQTQAPGADGDVGWAAADVGGEAGDVGERGADVIGVEID